MMSESQGAEPPKTGHHVRNVRTCTFGLPTIFQKEHTYSLCRRVHTLLVMATNGRGQLSNEERPLFCRDWTARQEHKLLESIDEYGYGNWCVDWYHI